MSHDPQESVLDDDDDDDEVKDEEVNEDMEYVTDISPSDEWLTFRNTMPENMFNVWSNR